MEVDESILKAQLDTELDEYLAQRPAIKATPPTVIIEDDTPDDLENGVIISTQQSDAVIDWRAKYHRVVRERDNLLKILARLGM